VKLPFALLPQTYKSPLLSCCLVSDVQGSSSLTSVDSALLFATDYYNCNLPNIFLFSFGTLRIENFSSKKLLSN